MTNRNVFLLELLVAAVVTVPLALALRPAMQASTWPSPVLAVIVLAVATALAILIDFTAMLLRRPRRQVRRG